MIGLLWIVLALLGLYLFFRFKPPVYQSLLLDKETARQKSAEFIRTHLGVDVSKWKSFAVYWYDHDTVNKLHHVGLLNQTRQVLYNWGLLESWRIRFVSQNQSIITGVNAKGEITFFHADVRKKNLQTTGLGRVSLEQLKEDLAVDHEGLWAQAKATGSGEKQEDLEQVTTYWYMAESANIRMKMAVELYNQHIISLQTEQEIRTENMNKAVQKEQLESTLGITGVLGSCIAVVAAIIVLIHLDVRADMTVSMIMGSILAVCNLFSIKEDIQLTIVNAYDSRMSLKMVSSLAILSAVLAGILIGFVVFICSLAGNSLGENLHWPIWEKVGNQLLSGGCAGIICLGLSAVFFSVLEKKKWLRISPELSNRTIYLSGFTFRQGLNMSLQSSLVEETVYRLLMIPAIWFVSHSVFITLLVSSGLWAIMHQGTGYHPRWLRWIHLFAFGCFLGLLFIESGFLAVFAAHFIYNFILFCMPLWNYNIQRKLNFKKTSKQSSF
ncbi:CPBP family intramembrane metalloprotease [Bacillus sp. WMMC1349]|uniref:CPBP family intramembrane glutamic endopeptidase n=1 Tax=Bacillus sp. WMMC1349 TaxID=2736254 RepID=UPI0015560F8E|nr:CPBP family intramembrane glutamic endopeptidase [Bacillus sp. WMMC1349]NPC91388.1 CPBP family intramembrane metalloprotease [Bacillus sp. WMMC1349]